MVALSQAQGIVLAIGGAVFLAVAGAVLFARARRPGEPAPDIPSGMRPGPSDADLETPLLQKLQGWGVLLVVFFVVWVPVTWLFEPDRNLEQENGLQADAIERGSHAVELFNEENQAGVGCVQCHGPELEGGVILNTEVDPQVPRITPNLTNVCGGPYTGHSAIYGLTDIYTVVEQGRGQMPSWSVRFEGALNDQQINDIVTYIVSIQDESIPFEQNVCINPEAREQAVEDFLNGQIENKPNPTDNIEL